MATRDLYIVAADRKDLYKVLRKQFADNENVEVILDRRQGERRAAAGGTKREKRKSERRRAEEAHLLRTLGVILVAGTKKPASRRGRGA
ncbi:MAG: hypothetical protein HY616_06650 [Candidatus Rokubacteria bacterium]|nr:hypothetical protein [Candidatus Rokubacteria bacterium]MBI2014842.1 hypothetical protein [Candidatus Rokubacteria bacterium]MBI2157849.1 hypothetical protein [Candidatus Rokubacteria bacterium]MBI2494503.1 hypothetical protein [Candidatus Rokubacteria bacterium]MBI4254737.1 hypothetical protein [Candidatus Rokubacteria bacterium]